MKSLLLTSSVLLFLTGCADAPVGYGGSHRAVLANDKSVTYVYDPIMGGYNKAMRDSTKHCKSYGKSPVLTFSGKQGVLGTLTFECR
jgi:hypothetical protein|tara:strand:- start:670 stop:930 length:261 start_codon:yes stop_codon:yes gene_type:complete